MKAASVRSLASKLAGRKVYYQGAVAELVSAGMDASSARRGIDDAVREGLLRKRGVMLEAAEPVTTLAPAKLVRRSGNRWVVATRTKDGMYVSRDTRRGEGELAIGDTLSELISGGAKWYRSRRAALAGAASAYWDVPTEAAENGACGCAEGPTLAIMAEELTDAQRRRLPDSEFAYIDPRTGERLFPVHDAQHAKSAMGLLHTWYPRGRFTDREYEQIRRNILKAYKRFGIEAHAPSLHPDAEGKPIARRLGVAAETQNKELKMALSKAQRREIALKNLQKAWAAQGRGGSPGKSGKKYRPSPMPSAMETKSTRATREHYERLAKAWGAQGRDTAPLVASARRAGIKVDNNGKKKAIKARSTQKAGSKTRAASKPSKPKSSPRSSSKAASKSRRRTPKISGGKFISPNTGQMISIRRVYPRKNPWIDFSWQNGAAFAGGMVGGLLLSAGADRFISTMGEKNPKYGMTAARAIHARPDAVRMGAQFLGMTVFGATAYFTRMYPAAMIGSASAALAFTFRLLLQLGSGVIAPLIVKADKATDRNWKTRLFPDMQDWAQPGATAALGNGNGAGTAGAYRMMPRVLGSAPRLPAPPPALPVARTGVGQASDASEGDIGVGGCGVCGDDVAKPHKRFTGLCQPERLPDGRTPEDTGDDGFVRPPVREDEFVQPPVRVSDPNMPDVDVEVDVDVVPGTEDGGFTPPRFERRPPNRLADVIRLAARRPGVSRTIPNNWGLRYPERAEVR